MAAPTCWIGVAARAHVLRGMAEHFVMFAHGSHSAVKRLGAGDWFAYYSPTETLGGKDAVRRFTAIGRIRDAEPVAMLMTEDASGWRRGADYLAADEADIYPLLSQLRFVVDRAHWGMYFRQSLFKVDTTDFSCIAEAMGVGPQFNPGE
jgi:hypothetical protein